MSATLAERFWPKVRQLAGDGCWLWTAALDGHGYGMIYVGGSPGKAHRISWSLANGPIPRGRAVLHRCDTPACVRPDHLFIGTQVDNLADMKKKGRHQHGSGHYLAKLDDDGVRAIRAAAKSGERLYQIARRFGLNRMTVKAVIQRKTWKHVPETSP